MDHRTRGLWLTGALAVIFCCPAESLSDGSSPFTPGNFSIGSQTFTPKHDGCPMATTMHYPKKAGLYTPILFLGGFYDWANTNFYTNLLRNVTQHGYFVFGIDRYQVPGVAGLGQGQITEVVAQHKPSVARGNVTLFETMNWLKNNVQGYGDAKIDWDRLTMGCHSASCDETLKIVENYPQFAAASIFIDPVSIQSPLMEPVKTRTASLCYVSQKSFTFPTCCIQGMSYKRFFELIESLAVRMMVKEFGHCDLLDGLVWDACHDIHICPTAAKDRIPLYKTFTAGMIHAFLRFSLYGDVDMQKYVIDPSFMPLPVTDVAFKRG